MQELATGGVNPQRAVHELGVHHDGVLAMAVGHQQHERAVPSVPVAAGAAELHPVMLPGVAAALQLKAVLIEHSETFLDHDVLLRGVG